MKVIGELEDVFIWLSSNEKVCQFIDIIVCQFIDIIVADIPEAYGFVLSRNWSAKLNGYFASDWSHLWLPYKEVPIKLKF